MNSSNAAVRTAAASAPALTNSTQGSAQYGYVYTGASFFNVTNVDKLATVILHELIHRAQAEYGTISGTLFGSPVPRGMESDQFTQQISDNCGTAMVKRSEFDK